MNDHELLIRIDERMEQVLSWQDEHMKRCHTTHERHDREIKELQEWKWKETGALGLLVFLVEYVKHWFKGGT